MVRAIILAAGADEKWTRPGRRQMLEVDGESLLHRAIRLLRERDVTNIVVTEPATGTYTVDAPTSTLPARELWGDGRTVELYGDTYYTDAAMDTILAPNPGIRFFVRFGPSRLTGCEWGEVWAVSFWTAHQALYSWALNEAERLHREGITNRVTAWEAVRLIAGADVKVHRWQPGLMTEIDDWTEDFDFPADFDRWMARR